MFRRLVISLVVVLGIVGSGVAYADQGPADRIDCWIPQPQKPEAPSVSRQRTDGTWEVLVASGRLELLSGPTPLCVEVIPGLYVWRGDREAVEGYLHGVNGEALFYGVWVERTPMLYGMARIAWCESRGRWQALSPDGKYGGIFQIAGLDNLTDPGEQVRMFYSIYDRQGWGAWRNCAIQMGLLRSSDKM